MEIKWRRGFRGGIPADAAHEELERVREERGLLQPDAVVDAARDEDSPLHPCFTWDQEKAALEWNKSEARDLIQNLVVVDSGTREERAPVYISVALASGDRSYTPTNVVVADRGMRESSVADALRQIEGWCRRYGSLEDLRPITEAIEAVRSRIGS